MLPKVSQFSTLSFNLYCRYKNGRTDGQELVTQKLPKALCAGGEMDRHSQILAQLKSRIRIDYRKRSIFENDDLLVNLLRETNVTDASGLVRKQDDVW